MNGLSGVVCLMDNVLVFGKNETEHDEHLEAVLKQIVLAEVMLNSSKCEFSKILLRHIVNQYGIQADLKDKEILNM